MSRRRVAEKRDILPDPKFGSKTLTQFINVVMERGKKSIAEKIVYGALDKIQADTKKDSLPLFEMAVSNVRPIVEVKSRRVGGATYQVPIEVKPNRQSTLAMRWIVDAARKRTEMSMPHRLAGELQDSAAKRGNAIKKREDTHRMAEANRAFSHYRW